MAYEKQNFVDGKVLYAASLNQIEDELVTKSSVYVQNAEPADAENGDLWVMSVEDSGSDDDELIMEQVQVDWNQNNTEAVDFIKNRPFYESDAGVKKLDSKFLPLHISNDEPENAKDGDLWIDTDERVEIEVPEEPETIIVTGDWSQNDSTALDYIKNRTHWEEFDGANINWNGVSTGRVTVLLKNGDFMVKVSDNVPTIDSISTNGRLIMANGSAVSMTADKLATFNDSNAGYYFEDKLIVIKKTDYIFNDASYPETGIYVHFVDESDYVKNVYYGTSVVHKIDPKFLPEPEVEDTTEIFVQTAEPADAEVGDIWIDTTETVDVLPASIMLASSTPGSTKKFKLSITDDGELSIEEVV